MHQDMKSTITQWGNSLGVRIPKAFAEQIGLRPGNVIDLEIEDDQIIIRKPKYRLRDLVSGIHKNNLHDEVDFGKPKGKEIW